MIVVMIMIMVVVVVVVEVVIVDRCMGISGELEFIDVLGMFMHVCEDLPEFLLFYYLADHLAFYKGVSLGVLVLQFEG